MINIYYIHNGDGTPIYVGKTTNLKERLKCHKQTRPHFTHIELIEMVNDDEWKFWEEFYIELFLSWGFDLENKTRKGHGCGARPCKWGDKISQSNKGKQRNWRDKNEIEIRRQRQKGKQYLLGHKYTEEQKQNLLNGKRKTFHQYDLDGNFIEEWFATQSEIARFFQKDVSSLTQHLKNKQKSAYGYIWKKFDSL